MKSKNKTKRSICLKEEEYKNSHYNNPGWEKSVTITNWLHDFEKKIYIINIIE